MRKLKVEEMQRLSTEEFEQTRKIPLVIVLDNIRSAHNVGSVFRTSDAFLVEKVYLCGICAKPPHKEILKTALGATETVDWEYAESTLEVVESLKKDNHHLVAIEQVENSENLEDFQPKKQLKYALILGNEVEGVSQEVLNQCDTFLEIPQYGTKHSLNISVCAGISIWKFFSGLS